MEKTIFNEQRACNEALHTLFRAVYFIKKNSLFHIQNFLYCMIIDIWKIPITSNMHQDKINLQ